VEEIDVGQVVVEVVAHEKGAVVTRLLHLNNTTNKEIKK
jgi:hypothetical protein